MAGDGEKEDTELLALRELVSDFERTIRRRNARELAASALVTVAFCGAAFLLDPVLLKASALLTAAGAVAVAATILTRAKPPSGTVDGLDEAALARRHKPHLLRQVALLQSVHRWYLGPLIPGLALGLLGMALVTAGRATPRWWSLIATAAVIGAVTAFILRMNRRLAAELLRQASHVPAGD